MSSFVVKSAASSSRLSLSSSSSSLSSPLRLAMFHSTPAVDRKRRTDWDSAAGAGNSSKKRFNIYPKRLRKSEAKRVLLRNVSAYAEHLFQGWKTGSGEAEPSNKGTSWFRGSTGSTRSKKYSYHPQESDWQSYISKRWGNFDFVFSDDDEVETIFRSAFKGARFSYWSSTGEEDFRWRNSWDFCNEKASWNWRSRAEDDYDRSSYNQTNTVHLKDVAANLQVLGLSTTAPLELEKVKNAYRACALKWHPDRHQGFAKIAAEEKFKRCSAAYQSLCDKLEVA